MFGLVCGADDVHWRAIDVKVNVDKGAVWSYWDGRTCHPAVWHRGPEKVDLDACVLGRGRNNEDAHLQFAQTFAHVACLLKEFKCEVENQLSLTGQQKKQLHALRVSWQKQFNLAECLDD